MTTTTTIKALIAALVLAAISALSLTHETPAQAPVDPHTGNTTTHPYYTDADLETIHSTGVKRAELIVTETDGDTWHYVARGEGWIATN
jgi:hypothetical protein